jgi:hypothetical protein
MNACCIHIRVISFLVFIVEERSYYSCDEEKRYCMCFFGSALNCEVSDVAGGNISTFNFILI